MSVVRNGKIASRQRETPAGEGKRTGDAACAACCDKSRGFSRAVGRGFCPCASHERTTALQLPSVRTNEDGPQGWFGSRQSLLGEEREGGHRCYSPRMRDYSGKNCGGGWGSFTMLWLCTVLEGNQDLPRAAEEEKPYISAGLRVGDVLKIARASGPYGKGLQRRQYGKGGR